MKYIAIFNFDPEVEIEEMLGFNLYQRMYYFKNKVTFLNVRKKKELIKYLFFAILSRKELTIITERNIFGVVGFSLSFLPKVNWIVDIQDCPLKESESFYKKRPIKKFLSYSKGKLVYYLYKFSDKIIVSYSKKRFLKFYSGDLDKVTFMLNGLPNLDHFAYPVIPKGKKIQIIYQGARLPDFGVEFAEQGIQNLNRQGGAYELHIFGHSHPEEKPGIYYHGKQPRNEVINAMKNAHICISPFHKGTDIEFTFPIKVMEYFSFGNKLVLSDCEGVKEQLASSNSKDIHFYEASNLESLQDTLKRVTQEIKKGEIDKVRDLSFLSASKKHEEIWKIYESI
jgi:glycosyltransferase involved in cell wall biosynthesis